MFDWTPEADATLTVMREDVKVSSTEIGKLLGCSRMAVIGRASRLGLDRLKPGTRPGDTKTRAKGEAVYTAPTMLIPPLFTGFCELQADQCKEVVGRGDDGLAQYCGHPQKENSSYCCWHHAINWEVPTGKMRPFIRPRVRAA